MRSFKLLTFFILSSVASHHCHSGVITVNPDGKPTKWVSDAGTTYDLYEDSYFDAFINNYDDDVTFDFSRTEARNLASALAKDATDSALQRTDFVIGFAQGSHGQVVRASFAFYFPSRRDWASTDFDYSTTAHFLVIFRRVHRLIWAATSANSQNPVPEPSTAIAMGLLGVLGFAGSRRRKELAESKTDDKLLD